MSVLHISFDYPDSIVPRKTQAVFNLVQSQTKYGNCVFSLNRSGKLGDDFKLNNEPFGYSMKVYGLPFGIGLNLWMYLTSRKIEKIIKQDQIPVSIIHAHKLSSEGLIAFYLSKKLNIPYILTVRGDSDLKFIRFKRESRIIFKKVIEKSSAIIFIAPWTLKELQAYFPTFKFGINSILIPNIIHVPKRKPLAKFKSSTFLTVFNFDSYKRKNIKRIIQAFDNLHNTYPEITLEIIGTGNESAVSAVQGYVNACKFPGKFQLLGHKNHDEVMLMYSNYLAFILPSYPETFGLVFIEALAGGIPIIYAEKSGVDGFFEDSLLGVKVPWNQAIKIEQAIAEIYLHKEKYRQSVSKYVEGGGLEIFSKNNVSAKYINLLEKIMDFK